MVDLATTKLKAGQDYIGVTVVFLCHDGQGRFLMMKRSKACRDEQGRWDCGGGKLEFGETIEDGLRREVAEEYCTNVRSFKRLYTDNLHCRNGKELSHWIVFGIIAEVDSERIAIGDPEKIDEIGWFTPENLPAPLHSGFPRMLRTAKDYLSNPS